MPTFRWEDIDHSLVGLRLTELAIEMHARIKADEARIQFENRGNLNSSAVPSQVLMMKRERADELAQGVYEIYCDVWQKQGNVKSGDSVRAIFARGIVPVIRARTGAIVGEFLRFATATNFPAAVRDATMQGFHLTMKRLEDHWQRRLEIEAKECEHAEGVDKSVKNRVSHSAIPPIEAPQEEPHPKKGLPRKKTSLGPKKQDLSQYLDSAKLTERQHECISLKFEYELTLSEIARRLGIDRKTAEEHVALGEAKLQRQGGRGRHQKNLTKVKPGGLDR